MSSVRPATRKEWDRRSADAVALQQKRAQQQHKTGQRTNVSAEKTLAEAEAQPPLQQKRARQQQTRSSVREKLAEAGAQPPPKKAPAAGQTVAVQSCRAFGNFSPQVLERGNFVDIPRPCVGVESVFACHWFRESNFFANAVFQHAKPQLPCCHHVGPTGGLIFWCWWAEDF